SNMEPGKVLELYGTEGMLETYRRIQGLDELPPDTARELTEEALDMIRTTLREMNITEDYLENRI
ncbi:MAG: hypothetical protein KAT70_03995, partial [Thermoplasmata archaeon]|nr:hypothetical protein [Thermoplasmata archaeon]